MILKCKATLGQLSSAPGAYEQPVSKRIFQRVETGGYGGLRNVQLLGGLVQVPRLNNGKEGLEAGNVNL